MTKQPRYLNSAQNSNLLRMGRAVGVGNGKKKTVGEIGEKNENVKGLDN